MSMILTIRDLEESVEGKLRALANLHGRSVEAEAREILKREVTGKTNEAAPDKPIAPGKFDHLVGLWKERGTTDEAMKALRGED